jgi:hypothetical protein
VNSAASLSMYYTMCFPATLLCSMQGMTRFLQVQSSGLLRKSVASSTDDSESVKLAPPPTPTVRPGAGSCVNTNLIDAAIDMLASSMTRSSRKKVNNLASLSKCCAMCSPATLLCSMLGMTRRPHVAAPGLLRKRAASSTQDREAVGHAATL